MKNNNYLNEYKYAVDKIINFFNDNDISILSDKRTDNKAYLIANKIVLNTSNIYGYSDYYFLTVDYELRSIQSFIELHNKNIEYIESKQKTNRFNRAIIPGTIDIIFINSDNNLLSEFNKICLKQKMGHTNYLFIVDVRNRIIYFPKKSKLMGLGIKIRNISLMKKIFRDFDFVKF